MLSTDTQATVCSVFAFCFLTALIWIPGPPSGAKIRRNGVYSAGPSSRVLGASKRVLSYTKTNFTLDGQPTRIISGSVHYFRAPPASWRRILRAARSMGLNAIETYVPWNLHEPTPGVFVFSGMLDLRLFLEIAHEERLLVLLRPGPYICAEWDMGGIPAWILRSDVELRRVPFLSYAREFFDVIAAQVRPYIGRPVVALQLENEFGAYGADDVYMHKLRRMWEVRGMRHLMLFTSDNGGKESIRRGSPFDSAEVLKTVNLEKDAGKRFELLRELQPEAPAMVGEFWSGWFDHWGELHHTRLAEDVVEQVEKILFEHGGSVNLYMFFGGTNFGFMNGANIDGHGMYQPTTTSYDYDGFVTEDAHIREEKYVRMQRMLRRFWGSVGNREMVKSMPKQLPPQTLLSAYAGRVELKESVCLIDVVDIAAERVFYSDVPVSMELAGSGYGYVLYRHNIDYALYEDTSHALSLQLGPVRDYAYVMCDGRVVATVERNAEMSADKSHYRNVKIAAGTNRIEILVENRGRVNYGRKWLADRKGLLANVSLGGKPMLGFTVFPISFSSEHELLPTGNGEKTLTRLGNSIAGRDDHPELKNRTSAPTLFAGKMWISPGAKDKFEDKALPGTYVRAFGRGVIWINGFNLGRFHTGVPGPQRSLYVPGSLLKEGTNEILVLHQNMALVRGDPHPLVQFFAQADYGQQAESYDSRKVQYPGRVE